ncbi:hypothetical protein B9Y85_03805 [Stenotrophomonas maltophilia]|uniref:Fic family protein n=2 Tax=Lysobacteraceae TaxID=32033 RepID=A0A2J0T0I1_STEMA|nr:Fic family protein [Stenotrophomonas maltophilia]PJL03645.1 hypothetical protein B9Y57_06940 [Stenotrophomonas maltophilia]PJL30243.1 hypothetical protein B9Y65_06940 [Stenotrophomonas maltophilia]PJL69636.1 hypothetical protein B9Y85_03805 [Stenotrophomonas maltophilia]
MVEMKVRYGVSPQALLALNKLDLQHPVRCVARCSHALDLMASVASCRLRYCPRCDSRPDRFERCERARRYLKMSRKRDVARINGPLLCLLHKCAAEEADRSGSFRVNRIRVGSSGNPLSFVAAQVDVARIIREISPSYQSLETLQKAYFAVFIMSILHPFEDGNGRTMRMWLISLAASSESAEVAEFVSFLALYVKFRQRDLVVAMDQLSEGFVSGVQEFHAAAVTFFEGLFDEEASARVFDWAISIEPEGSLLARAW